MSPTRVGGKRKIDHPIAEVRWLAEEYIAFRLATRKVEKRQMVSRKTRKHSREPLRSWTHPLRPSAFHRCSGWACLPRPREIRSADENPGVGRDEAMRGKGTFWPEVRRRIWKKAEELYMQSHRECPNRPERYELREGGYFYRAKLIVLREIQLEAKPRCCSKGNT